MAQNNITTISKFLKAKGLSSDAIDGILGNLQVESGFSPSAFNANEGAIGIAQWENGRKTNLDAYASRTGGSETSLATQLGYMWSELESSYPDVLTALRQPGISPTDAAKIWESQYEGSASGSWSTREANARTFAANGGTGTSTSDTGGGSVSDGSAVVGATDVNWLSDVAGNIVPKQISGEMGSLFGDAANATGIPGAIDAVAKPFEFIGEFFNKLLWIFTPSHFIKVQMYLLGFILFITGVWLIISGAK